MTGQAIRAAVIDDQPGILLVTIDRPPVNALTPECYGELAAIFAGLPGRKDLRCVILTGAGDRAFCAGADIHALKVRTLESTLDRAEAAAQAFDAIRRAPLPVIGAINGPAIGIGCILAACCDLLVAAEHATFAIPEVALNVPAGIRHLNGMLPDRVARLLALTGRRLTAQEMQGYGALAAIAPKGQALPAAIALAEPMQKSSPAMLRLTKDAILRSDGLGFDDGYRVQQLYTAIALAMQTQH